jgi:hypothetical protein
MLPDDLPRDLPGFLERFGTDEQCRDYLIGARWPEGFRCTACGHGRCHGLRARLALECAACGRQHSYMAGTIFEQTKTGLARWFLAIWLVTSSKGGISAMELKRQMGFGSYQTAWSWLHKIRRAMVAPGRAPLAGRVEADETYLGAAQPGRARRCRQEQDCRRRRERSRQGARPPARPAAPGPGCRRLGQEPGELHRPQRRPAGRRRHRRLVRLCRPRRQGLCPRADQPQPLLGRSDLAPARHSPRLRPRQALALGNPSRCRPAQASPGLPRRVRLPLQPPHGEQPQPPVRPTGRARRPHPTPDLPRHRPRRRLNVLES